MAAERRISSIWHADLQSLGSVFRPATQFKAVSSESEISFLLPLVLVSFRSLALNIVCEIQWRTNLLDGVPGRLGRRSTGLRRVPSQHQTSEVPLHLLRGKSTSSRNAKWPWRALLVQEVSSSPLMVSTAVFDTVAAALLLTIALIGSYAPVFLHKKGGRSLTYILGNMLSAGVMISAGLVHLLGTAMQDLNSVTVFPLAPFLCGLGFILTLFADQAATFLTAGQGWELAHCGPTDGLESTSSSFKTQNGRHHGHKNMHEDIEMGSTTRNQLTDEQEHVGLQSEQNGFRNPLGKPQDVENISEPDGKSLSRLRIDPIASGYSDDRPSELADQPLVGLAQERSSSQLAAEAITPTTSKAGVLAMSLSPSADGRPQVSFVTAVLMAVALCFHSILEGTAMGAQSNLIDTAHIFIAIMAHKGLAAYALGSSVLESGASKARFWIVIGVFAAATPVGIAFGRLVANVAEGGPAAALSALASGTFLYVAFMEVIPKEMRSAEYGLSKLSILFLGFGAMSLLALWA